jgi:hypothetical protein
MRYSKVMAGTGRAGKAPFFALCDDVNAEAQFAARHIKKLIDRHYQPDEIAVIYRVNRQARAITDAFMNNHIPYRIKDVFPSVYEHWIALDIYAYLRLSYDITSDECLKRIINKPGRYISNALTAAAMKGRGGLLKNLMLQGQLQTWQLTRLEKLSKDIAMLARIRPLQAIKYLRADVGYDGYINKTSEYRHISPVGLFETLDELEEAAKNFDTAREFAEHMQNAIAEAREQKRKPVNDRPSVLLSTMHSAKGLEFDTVVVVGATEGVIPHEKSKTEQEIEEERRLFYVGLTRAKNHLVITSVKNRHETEATATRFLRGVIDTGEEPKSARGRVTKVTTGPHRVNIMDRKGFTLIDALMALLIFSILIVPVILTTRSVSQNFARAAASYETEQYLTTVVANALSNRDTAGYVPEVDVRYECVIIVTRPGEADRVVVIPAESDFQIQPAAVEGADHFGVITCGLRDIITGVIRIQASIF